MPKYIFAYHGGSKPETPEAGAQEMEKWLSWRDGMGAKCVDFGAPVGMSKTVSNAEIHEHGGSNPLSGYSIVQAENESEACEMAQGCPILKDGKGTVEVAPIMEM